MDLATRPAHPATTTSTTSTAGTPVPASRGVFYAACATTLLGTLMAVSAVIADYPVFTGQAVRYALAALVLLPFALRVPLLPRGPAEWGLLVLLSLTGLAGFNYCLVEATRSTDPATIGAVIGSVPVVMAVVAPLVTGRRPTRRVVLAALVVAAGAALVNGMGDGDLRGLLFSLGALTGEVLFSLLAVPLLPRLGALRVSAYSSALAVPLLLLTGLVAGESLRLPTPAEGLAFGYIGVVITAGAFLMWFGALDSLGPDRAALFGGLIPVSAAATGAALGLGAPSPGQLLGCLLVGLGVTCGALPAGRRFTLGAATSRDL
ncbi:DMT family transporter [Actinocorallia populi]|uniref:DMT family transporter n=1 Tax=Actinocorallia populi TaxID=2079200 RepID=UPI000D092A32|nr:DMT family transporter [Actinocorallia populi]